MLLVQRLDEEAEVDFVAFIHACYHACPGGAELGSRYKVGPTFVWRARRFSQIRTWAGSLVTQVVFDTKKGKFSRSVIFLFNPEDRFTLLNPDGSECALDEDAIVRLDDC